MMNEVKSESPHVSGMLSLTEVLSTRLLKHLRIILPNKMAGATHRVLVFALYKPEASRVAALLKREKYRVSELHGGHEATGSNGSARRFQNGAEQRLGGDGRGCSWTGYS